MIRKVICIVLLLGSMTSLDAQKTFSNEEIWYSSTFRMDNVRGQSSMDDGMHYTRLEQTRGGNAIYKYSYRSGEQVAELVNSSMLDGNSIDDYSFSQDESKILIATEQESIYRHSTKAYYLLYDLQEKEFSYLSDKKNGKVRLAEYSPDGTKVAYVKDNDLYYKNLASSKVNRVTTDGKFNSIINGATDWVYEEEFSFDKGFYWSKDGGYLAYYRFDESAVKEFQMAMYGNLYPDQYTFKYPKAGEDKFPGRHIYTRS